MIVLPRDQQKFAEEAHLVDVEVVDALMHNKFTILFIITFWCCPSLFGQHLSISKIDSIELTDPLEKKNLFIDNFYVNHNIIIIEPQHKLTIYTPDLNLNNVIQFKKARKDDKILYVDSLIIKLSRRKVGLFNIEFKSITKFKHELKKGYFLNKVVGNKNDFHLLYEKRPENELETPKLIAIRIKELKIYETKTFFDIQFPKHFKFSLYNKNISSNHVLVSNVGDPKIYHFDRFFNNVNSFGTSINMEDYKPDSSGGQKQTIYNNLASNIYLETYYLPEKKIYIRLLKAAVDPKIIEEEFKFGYPKGCGPLYWFNLKPDIIQIYNENGKLIDEFKIDSRPVFIGSIDESFYSVEQKDNKIIIYKYNINYSPD